jgi:hypothetical protein
MTMEHPANGATRKVFTITYGDASSSKSDLEPSSSPLALTPSLLPIVPSSLMPQSPAFNVRHDRFGITVGGCDKL